MHGIGVIHCPAFRELIAQTDLRTVLTSGHSRVGSELKIDELGLPIYAEQHHRQHEPGVDRPSQR